MKEARQAIRDYLLQPDYLGNHLRQLAEHMAALSMANTGAAGREAWQDYLEAAAETIASYIHLVWGEASSEVYAPATLEMLQGLQNRVRGMDPSSTWDYALDALATDIRIRLARAAKMTIDPELESALLHHFFDSLDEFAYLHDVAGHIKELHWRRRHSPQGAGGPATAASAVPAGPRGDRAVETHLHRVAIESLATYIEQSNIARGNIAKPTDPVIVLRDRIDIQLRMGGKNAETWAASGRQLADAIESRFGTAEGRREARKARARWKALARMRG